MRFRLTQNHTSPGCMHQTQAVVSTEKFPSDVWMEDLRLCTMVDRFNFAMQVQMEGSNFVIRKVDSP